MRARSYAVSVARKLGSTIFVLPEDLVECRTKMVTIFAAALLAVDHLKGAATLMVENQMPPRR